MKQRGTVRAGLQGHDLRSHFDGLDFFREESDRSLAHPLQVGPIQVFRRLDKITGPMVARVGGIIVFDQTTRGNARLRKRVMIAHVFRRVNDADQPVAVGVERGLEIGAERLESGPAPDAGAVVVRRRGLPADHVHRHHALNVVVPVLIHVAQAAEPVPAGGIFPPFLRVKKSEHNRLGKVIPAENARHFQLTPHARGVVVRTGVFPRIVMTAHHPNFIVRILHPLLHRDDIAHVNPRPVRRVHVIKKILLRLQPDRGQFIVNGIPAEVVMHAAHRQRGAVHALAGVEFVADDVQVILRIELVHQFLHGWRRGKDRGNQQGKRKGDGQIQPTKETPHAGRCEQNNRTTHAHIVLSGLCGGASGVSGLRFFRGRVIPGGDRRAGPPTPVVTLPR
ncbi:MAG: hypothetical protein BWX84_02178 [Verrucomicrobia bacterium ADurb.Bin118]|nr:MAG: hypothetical protein BWX84_02178 [Verrucomicrobia bacterium ADurb.Bin118]